MITTNAGTQGRDHSIGRPGGPGCQLFTPSTAESWAEKPKGEREFTLIRLLGGKGKGHRKFSQKRAAPCLDGTHPPS